MYDSVSVSSMPLNGTAYAGYVGGNWRTYPDLFRAFPGKRYLSIAVNAGENAQCLDIERGDATAAQAPEWVRRQIKRGVEQPRLYTSVSNVLGLTQELSRAGIRWRKRNPLRGVFRAPQVKLFTAHYTGVAHLCDRSCAYGMPQRADATQFATNAEYDTSYCAPDFL